MLGLLLALSGAIAGTARASDATPATTERLQALDGQILTRLNATRAAHGLRPLVVSDGLENAAVTHSRDLIQAGVFQHDSPDGTSFVQRLKHFYSPSGYSSWTAGENILYNTADIDADTAIRAWLDSPPHRENMLNPDWREVGIGSVHASTAGRHVWRCADVGDHNGLRRPHRRRQGCREGACQRQGRGWQEEGHSEEEGEEARRRALPRSRQRRRSPSRSRSRRQRPRRIPRPARRTSRPWQAHPTRSTEPRSATGPTEARTRARTLHREARISLPCRRRPSRTPPAPGPRSPRPLRARGTASSAGRC